MDPKHIKREVNGWYTAAMDGVYIAFRTARTSESVDARIKDYARTAIVSLGNLKQGAYTSLLDAVRAHVISSSTLDKITPEPRFGSVGELDVWYTSTINGIIDLGKLVLNSTSDSPFANFQVNYANELPMVSQALARLRSSAASALGVPMITEPTSMDQILRRIIGVSKP